MPCLRHFLPGHRSGRSRSLRRLASRATVTGLLVLAGWSGGPACAGGESTREADAPASRFVLPEVLDHYADPDLPRHFDSALVRSFENTPPDNAITDEGATLGRVLFYDKRLSVDGTISCASCHLQSRAFSSPERFSRGVEGRLGDRNAMSLVEARYAARGRFFWDERAETLEQQVLEPIANPKEMGHSVPEVVKSLRADPAYAPLFRKAFGDSEVDAMRVGKALAQFLRAMSSHRSKFDEGMAGAGSIFDPFENFSVRENLGKSVFLGDHDLATRGNCASCHLRGFDARDDSGRDRQQAVFLSDGPRNNGLTARLVAEDNGVGDVTLDPGDYGRFKTPSLRNVELTAPYMHDGRFATLEDVVEHYNSGVKPHPNLDPRLFGPPPRPGARPSPRKLRLDGEEKAALVAFLKTLTDWPLVNDPRFSDPFSRHDANGSSPPEAAPRH